MEYDRNTTFSNMYFGTEIRFGKIAERVKQFAAKLHHRPETSRKPIAA